jgi:alpha-D-xyloside xylohydrolase
MDSGIAQELYGLEDGRLLEAGWPDLVESEEGGARIGVPLRRLGASERAEGYLSVVLTCHGEFCVRVTVTVGLMKPVVPISPMLESLPETVQLHVKEIANGGGWRGVDTTGRTRFVLERPALATDPWSDLLPPPNEAFHLTVYPDGERAVRWNAMDHFFPAKVDAPALGVAQSQDGAIHSIGGSLALEPGEVLSGTGERFAGMDLTGRTICLENADAMGVNNRSAYKNVPWVLSSRGYGVFLHTSLAARLSLGDHSTRSLQFAVPGQALDLFLIGGGDPDTVLRHFRELTGVPGSVPRWSLGIWMSRMTYFTAAEVESITQRLREEAWPCDVIHLDTGWFAKDWVCEWEFGENFPDPAAFMERLREDGFRVSLWQNPNILRECRWLDELQSKGFLGERIEDTGQQGGESDFSDREVVGQIDFTHPSAVAWYQDKLRGLLQLGAEAIKTDFGETINMQTRYKGMPATELANLYALLYQKAAAEVTAEERGHALIWARAGWAGCQRYPVHWGGDCACTWDGMAASLRGGLHIGLSGFACWSHDVPGFHGLPDFMNNRPSAELYLRWTQFGCFTSHFRYHGTSEREPWFYPDVADLVRAWWRLRYVLIPYIEQECEALRRTGRPFLAALCFEDSEDSMSWKCDDQFMAGRDLLVAPVMNESGRRGVWLPKGEWIDLWTGEIYAGRQWLAEVVSDLARCPVYVRNGAHLPVCLEPVQHTGEIRSENVGEFVVNSDYVGIAKSPFAELVKELF